MKKIKLFIAALVLASAGVAISINSRTSNDPFFEANLEALSSNESAAFPILGHHYEVCGALLIDAAGRPYNCTKLIIRCDFINDNNCDSQGCNH